MCTELLPPGGYPTAVNKIYHIISYHVQIFWQEAIGSNLESKFCFLITIFISFSVFIVQPVFTNSCSRVFGIPASYSTNFGVWISTYYKAVLSETCCNFTRLTAPWGFGIVFCFVTSARLSVELWTGTLSDISISGCRNQALMCWSWGHLSQHVKKNCKWVSVYYTYWRNT
jgi:hypothetical protein